MATSSARPLLYASGSRCLPAPRRPRDRGSAAATLIAAVVALAALGTLLWNLGWIKPRRPPEATLTVSPDAGLAGSTVSVSGSGFANSETVTIAVHEEIVGTTTTDDSGTFATQIQIPL